MDIVGTGKRVRIYIGEKDRAPGHHEPLWETILRFLQQEGAAGATMLRGLAGFGAHQKLHMARLADIVTDLPVVIEWLDGPERVERLLPQVSAMVREGTITVEAVEIVKYAHREPLGLPPDSVADVMTRDVVAVNPRTPAGEVVRLLLERDFRSVPVVDDQNRVVGIMTNRDLIERGGLTARVELLGELNHAALERELASSATRCLAAADILTADVISVRPYERLAAAAHVMVERRIKRLPVVDEAGRLVGMLSRVDVLRAMGEDYHAPPTEARTTLGGARVVGEVMRTDVPSVPVDAPLGEVLDQVTSTRLNRAIVVDTERRVVGVVSDADLLARLDPGAETTLLDALMRRAKAPPKTTRLARDVMRAPAVTASPQTPVAEAVHQMLRARRKVLPVVDAQNRLLGAVDRADLLSALSPAPPFSA